MGRANIRQQTNIRRNRSTDGALRYPHPTGHETETPARYDTVPGWLKKPQALGSGSGAMSGPLDFGLVFGTAVRLLPPEISL